MANDIQEKTIFAGAKLIADVSLIKVMVIKKKFVEQMETWWENKTLPFENIEYIGYTEPWVLFRLDGKLWKIHQMQYKDKLQTKFIPQTGDVDWRTLERQVSEVFNKLPQIFSE